jgi:hypothetical protein
MTEEERYARVQEQMKELLDAAATDLNPATNLLRAMLYAEMRQRNELVHMRVMEVRTEFVQTLWALAERKQA